MPELCRFDGIITRMRFRDHPPPHFHVEFEVRVDIGETSLASGRLPTRIRRLVLEWATLRQDELREAWNRVSRHETPGKIAPLT